MLKKFSEVSVDGCCPKCGYAVMKRGINAVTSSAASVAAYLAVGPLLSRPARKKITCGGCGAKYLLG